MSERYERSSLIVCNQFSGNGKTVAAARRMQEVTGSQLFTFQELISKSLEELQQIVDEVALIYVHSGDGSVLSLTQRLVQLRDQRVRTVIACGGGGANVIPKELGTNVGHLGLVAQAMEGTLLSVPAVPFSVGLDCGAIEPVLWTVNMGFSNLVLKYIEQNRLAGKKDFPRRLTALGQAVREMQTSDGVQLRVGTRKPQTYTGVSVTATMFPWWSDKIQYGVPNNAAVLLQTIKSPEKTGAWYVAKFLSELVSLSFNLGLPCDIIQTRALNYGTTVTMESLLGTVGHDSELRDASRADVSMRRPGCVVNEVRFATSRRLLGATSYVR